MNEEAIQRCRALVMSRLYEFFRGQCGFDDEEFLDIAMTLCHRKLYIGQIENLYHISARTLERYIKKGYLPSFKSEPSGKKYLFQDEIEKFLMDKKNIIEEKKKITKKSIIDKLLRRK